MSGSAFRRRPSVPRTSATDVFVVATDTEPARNTKAVHRRSAMAARRGRPATPTRDPVRQRYQSASDGAAVRPYLADDGATEWWPTPTASDWKGPNRSDSGSASARSVPTIVDRRTSWWAVEPDVGRVAHGIPSRVDRLRCLGNAVVPQVAQWIGHQIMAAQ